MVSIKSKEEIKKMKIAGEVLGQALQFLKKMIQPGINCQKLDEEFLKFITERNCQSNFYGYYDYPAHICISINEQLIHGIPQNRVLRNGDLVSIDTGCIYEGYHADAAITVICGDYVNPLHKKLVEDTQKSLQLAIEQVRAGVRIGTISATVQKFIEENGFQLPTDFAGHGIGTSMHEDPLIPNTGIPNTGMRLQAGMTICIEPMVQISTSKTITASDGWTVSSADNSMAAHFEHTILVTEEGCEILTLLKD
ncbi:methionine aminopeptidase [Spiroplasma sabaudiense Ar-1343]|uniref:Methionine aminopeptidase n=1 Tax=Spiroplasma sabaudiense Ar-1343 TaxID=1276257 RepID=W6AAC1_9MOLU|nr:type I methionyl aminopeptidase [Spiroplasma sabaudiense]AHI54138.1 methionine aminopeptidase [Spiroplasma sabaudiense Ar-1343]